MDTPICDFVRRYAESDLLRLHMPGHKGQPVLGMESLDITEINGADSLYEASGIIRRSEENAGKLFGCHTFYSTEGSSLCIRAMLYLTVLYARQQGKQPLIAAARNVHKTFLSAAALLDFDIHWLYPEKNTSYLSCVITAEQLDAAFSRTRQLPTAVYLTSPDYLGNVADVQSIAKVCRRYGVLLLVDNAHGAYLKFLPESRHPMDLGADLCCDSAHKTLPVLTGGAYLHISPAAPPIFTIQAKRALAMFGSTSPSYLILQSLDSANRILSENYREKLSAFAEELCQAKNRLTDFGYVFTGNELLKLTIDAKKYGYSGLKLAHILQKHGIICEFSDPDFLVLMLTPQNGLGCISQLENTLRAIPKKAIITAAPPVVSRCRQVMSIRDASLSPSETLPVALCENRILASASVGCPPAVPILICGEVITPEAMDSFAYYGIETCDVVIEELL